VNQLTKCAASSSSDDLLEALERDGACIVTDLLESAKIDAIWDEVMPYVEASRFGGDEFSGKQTRRTGALVARSPSCRDVVMDEKILAAAHAFLAPYTERILLHLTQTIYIGPGQGAQMLHRDRLAWGKHLPLSIEPQFNTLWALTNFTADNGATRVVPGSHKWGWERQAQDDEICRAEMSKGSVLLYTGSVIHSGGENRTRESRMGLNITYCLGWLRQEENQFLSCPPDIAKDLPHELQKLLGYTVGNYALGYYSDPECKLGRGAGILPPELAVGSKPSKAMSITS
jgi:ectoine hydroxylase-related dioxygenase (phytanoyl-CoA dioxygenase family)